VIRPKSLNLKRKRRVVRTLITLAAAIDPTDLDLERLLLDGVRPIITPPPRKPARPPAMGRPI
jgi:hypothetical protein